MNRRAWQGFGAVVALVSCWVLFCYAWLSLTPLLAVPWFCCLVLIGLPAGRTWAARHIWGQPTTSRSFDQRESRQSFELFLAALDPEQRTYFEDSCHSVFPVRGGHSGRRYLIDVQETTFNVRSMEGRRYCIVPAEPMPRWHALLLQKLMIEGDERRFLRVAVRGYPWREREQV